MNNSYSYQNITHAMLSSPPPLYSTSFTSTTGLMVSIGPCPHCSTSFTSTTRQMVSVGQANEWDDPSLSVNRSYSYPQISMQGHTGRASSPYLPDPQLRCPSTNNPSQDPNPRVPISPPLMFSSSFLYFLTSTIRQMVSFGQTIK